MTDASLRLLFLSPWHPFPMDTGSRTRVFHLIRGLAARHEVSLATFNPGAWAPAQPDAIANMVARQFVVDWDPFVVTPQAWLRALSGLAPAVARPNQDMVKQIRRWHEETPFNVVIAATFVMAGYAPIATATGAILEEHNALSRWMQERYLAPAPGPVRLWRWASWKKHRLYETRSFRHFELVTMVSEFDAAATRGLTHNGWPPVAVVPNGVDTAAFRPGLAARDPNTVVFSGSLSYGPNLEGIRFFLNQVWPRVRADQPSARLLITGATQGVDLDALPLDDHVEVLGFVRDVRLVVASAAVSVVPILSGSGTRLKVLEAMALATPIVTTAKGIEGLAVRPSVHVDVADEPEAMAVAIVQLLRDRSRAAKLSIAARELVVEYYDWSAIASRFADMVEAVAAECYQGT